MEAKVPQQQSPPTSTKPIKPRKFRSSCDACSLSKVKCDQQQPQCLRCINLGVQCNFSPSRRMGKPPASARKLKPSSNASTESEPPIECHPAKKRQLTPPSSHIDAFPKQVREATQLQFDSPMLDTDCFMANWQDDIFDPATFSVPSTAELQLVPDNIFDLSFDFMGLGDTGIQLQDNNQYVFSDESSTESRRSHSHESMFDLSQVPQPFTTPSSTKTSPSLSSRTSLTLCTHNLDSIRSSVLSPTACPDTTIDQVLINNKAAIENAGALLACSCSDSSHCALSLALICNKILGSYENVVKAAACLSPSTRRRSSGSSIGITVGAYKMDAEDEERLRIQIVVNELRKVKGLVNTYGKKYCKKGENGEAGDGIYSALESFLRARLTTTLQELLEKLE